MRKITLLFAFLLMLSTAVSAATGWFSDYVKLNVNGAGESFYWIGSDPSFGTQLQGAALGSVNSLVITGCDMKYWSDTQDRTGGAFYYKVTNTAGTVDYIASTEVVWDQTYLGGNDYQGLKSTSVDLLAGLPYGTGNYKLQVWAKSWGSNQGDIYLSNDAANYVATFSYTKTNPTSFSGTYKVGESTGTNFTSLGAAVSAINAGTISGNVLLEITSDITEAANIGLGVNTNGFGITIRPDSDASRTITFTQLTDNSSPTGHFVIGYPSAGLPVAWSDANTIATSNVTIDGYAVGGSIRRLTFTNTNASHTNARVIVVVGACQNTIIRNCIINNLTTHTGSPFCVGAVVRKGTVIEVGPAGFTVENNVLTALGNSVAMGSRITNSGTLGTVKCTGFVFKNNIVTSRRRLVEINYTTGGEIYGNEFRTQQTGTPGTISYGLWTATGVDGTFNIYKNKFLEAYTEETGAYGHRVVSLASTATYNIYNNIFTGLNKTKQSTGIALNLTYLFYSGVSGTIYNNTFYLPALTNSSSSGYYSAIQLSGNTATIKNNIFICDEPTHSNTYFISSIPTPVPDYNLYYLRQSNANTKIVVGYSTLNAYKTANPTKDMNSISKNVSFVSTTDLSLAGSSINDVSLGVPRIATVLTDILGNNRGATTYMGAHEVGAIVATDLNAADITIANNGNVAVTKKGHLTFNDNKTINSLSIEGGGKVTLADTKSLTVNNFTIKSIADSTGTFVNRNETGGLTINGSKSVQQYLASSRNWYMSSPINDAKALSGYSYYQYNEPNGSLGTNWTSLNVDDDLTVGKGYIIKPAATDTYNFSTTNGTLNDGNIPVTIYRTDGVNKAGFNLVGNPYPSYVNVDNLVNSSVEASYWVRTRNAAQTGWTFDTYNIPSALSTGGSGKSVSKMISPMQAFWLRVKSPATQTTLNFTNGLRDHKDDLTNNFRAPSANSQSVLRLSVSDGINNDETLVYFNVNASNEIDAYDSHKMLNGETSLSPDIYTLSGIEQLAINGMSTIPSEIPLYIKPNASTSGQFSLTATEVSNFEAGTLVYIKDNKTGDQQLISDGSVYKFDVTTEPSLSIIIKAPGAVTGLGNNPDHTTMNVYANAKGQITVVLPSVREGDVARVYNSAGQCILNQTLTNTRTMMNKFFTAGVYVVKVNDTIRKVVIE